MHIVNIIKQKNNACIYRGGMFIALLLEGNCLVGNKVYTSGLPFDQFSCILGKSERRQPWSSPGNCEKPSQVQNGWLPRKTKRLRLQLGTANLRRIWLQKRRASRRILTGHWSQRVQHGMFISRSHLVRVAVLSCFSSCIPHPACNFKYIPHPPVKKSKSRSHRSNFIPHPDIQISVIPQPNSIFILIAHPAKPMLDLQSHLETTVMLWSNHVQLPEKKNILYEGDLKEKDIVLYFAIAQRCDLTTIRD